MNFSLKNKFFTQEVCSRAPKLLYAQKACADGGNDEEDYLYFSGVLSLPESGGVRKW